MIIDYIKGLLIGIFIVIVLLCVCITVDYADDNITVTNENISTCDVNDTSKVVGVDESNSSFVVKSSDKIYTIKEKTKKVSKLPVITIVAKPSCGCRHSYTWHKRSFVDYCPHCHHYNALYNKHKYQARYEQELTCKFCDSDFCGVCGKTKYSWSRVYLRGA